MRLNCFDERIWDRPDRFGLTYTAPATTQAGDSLQSVVQRRWDHPLGNSPFESPNDKADPTIDLTPADPSGNNRLADRVQLQRTELTGRRVAVELPEASKDSLMLPSSDVGLPFFT